MRAVGSEVIEKLWKGLLGWSEEDGVRVRGRLVWQSGDVQTAENDEDASAAIAIGQSIGAFRVGDVNLNRDQIQVFVVAHGCPMLDVLIEDYRLVVRPEIGGERGETEWWKQGVLDRSPVRTGRLGQGREDELDPQGSSGRHSRGRHVAGITNYFVLQSQHMVTTPGAIHLLIRMDALLSILLYVFGLVAAVSALAVIRPIPWLGLRTRRRALVAWLLAIAVGVGTLAWPAHETRVASPVSTLDRIVPIYQFSEVHETTIEASRERTYRAICAVTVNEIALLRTLTYIRRFGQPGPASVLNPPGDKPFCEVALSSGFYLLADEPPSEMVLGTFVVAPKAARANPTPQITAATFTAIRSPGFAIAVMNFRLQSIGSTRARLTTETRVFATDATIRWRFAAYWRVIYPGSSIIRMMWLRAIKRSAESPAASN